MDQKSRSDRMVQRLRDFRASVSDVEGAFAAGEVTDPHVRQVITSAGMGAAAAMEAEKYLANHAQVLAPAGQYA